MKKKVNQIFLRATQRDQVLVKEMQSVTFEATGSELISRLRFYEEVRIHRPKYNRKTVAHPEKVEFAHENLILVDRGRTPGEKSVVLVENNQYQGYAYTDLMNQISNMDILKELITSSPFNNAQNQIIKSYLNKKKVERIIRF